MNRSHTSPLPLISLLLSPAALQAGATVQHKMNIVIILADDLGWGDVGYHFSDIKTPYIDKLAQDGIVLDRFYTAPVSSPTRAGLLTGRYPNRFGIRETVIPPWRDFGLDPEEETLADMLNQADYANRAIIGKWHLGHSQRQYHPMSRGFTHFYGHFNGALNYFTHLRDGQLDWHNDQDPCYDKGYTTDLITAESVRCIQEYAKADSPFFLYVAFNAPHSPLLAKNEDIALYTDHFNQLTKEEQDRVTYSAMVTCMDRGIGAIRKALLDNGIEDNTLIVFFSDNGGDPNYGASNYPLRGNKYQEFDGGVRTPAIISYPARWTGKRTISQVVGFVDIMPTIRGLLNMEGEPKRPFDGIDISSLLSGGQPVLTRDLYLGCGAIVNNNYKLILKGKNDKVKIVNDFLSYYPSQYYEETNMWNKAAHQSEYNRLRSIVQQFDDIVPPFVLPPYEEGQDKFKAPFEWNMDYYGKTYDFPYPVSTYEDLMVIRNNLDKEFYLTDDITIPDKVEWVPLGAAVSEDNAPEKFKGMIDGKGFSVKNINIATESAFKGFIGQMENATITNLGVENVDIQGTTPVGGLAGALSGNNRIGRVFVTGAIRGTTEAGGLAGRSTATADTITDCYIHADVQGAATSNAKAGGLIGNVTSESLSAENVYVAGTVRTNQTANTTNYAGGLFGMIGGNTAKGGRIKTNSVAILTDEISAGTPNLFWGTALQENATSYENIFARDDIQLQYAGTNHGTGANMVTPDMLLDPTVFSTEDFYRNTLNWDFNTTWELPEGSNYPVFKNNPVNSLHREHKTGPWSIQVVQDGIIIITDGPAKISVFDCTGKMICNTAVEHETFIPLSRQGIFMISYQGKGKRYSVKIAHTAA